MYLIRRLRYWWGADRLGPDILLTHMFSYFPPIYRRICKKKFRYWGRGAELRPGASVVFCSAASVGENVVIRPGSQIFTGEEGVTIEDNVLLAPGVHIYGVNHKYDDPDVEIGKQGYKSKATTIKRGGWLGANVIVLPGVTIGEHAVVGAGSVVTKDIPSYSVWAGNPAKEVKTIERS